MSSKNRGIRTFSILAFISLLLTAFPFSSIFAVVPEKLILTGQQFTYSIGKELTKGTDIRVENIFPPHVRLERQSEYAKEHHQELKKFFKRATAVVTFRYAFPGDPLFPHARRSNIRVVEIDASLSPDMRQSGIALISVPGNDGKQSSSPFIWMNPLNYMKAAEIIETDLKRLFPKNAKRLNINLIRLKQHIFKLKSEYENKMAELERFEVIALSNEFVYFTESMNVETVEFFLKPEITWSSKDLEQFRKSLVKNEVKTVIHAWKPDSKILDIIKKAGAKLAVLDRIDPGRKRGKRMDPKGYLKAMKKNMEVLYSTLK